MRRQRTAVKSLTAEEAMIAANRYILLHYPTMYTGAMPRRLILPRKVLWAVPIVLTHPEHGVVGDVGLIAVDAASGRVVGATPRSEVVAAGRKQREARGHDLETAFLRSTAL